MIPLPTVERGREGERDKAIGMAELECGVAELKSVIAADIWCGRILPTGQTLSERGRPAWSNAEWAAKRVSSVNNVLHKP